MIDTEPMPETVAAVAALSGLRASYPLLATVAETEAWGGRSTPRPRSPMSEAAKERNDEQLRTERAERLYADRRGIRQSGNTHSPIRPALLDAELLAETTVVDQAWIAASALRQAETWLAGPRPYRGALGFDAAVTYLAVAIWDIQPATAANAAVELAGADRAVRAATGLADIRIPIPGNPTCLACGRRALRIDVTPADDRAWTVACRPDCVCWGTQCGCRRRGRDVGQVHIWTAEQAGLSLGLLRAFRRLDDSRRRAAHH